MPQLLHWLSPAILPGRRHSRMTWENAFLKIHRCSSNISQRSAPFSHALATNFGGLYPAYVRGEAYLAAHRGVEAAAEFQKILAHCGVVGADPVGALAHLQLGRAFALLGDKTKAKTAYQDFLTLWKDADPDIPILQQAKAEYAGLR